MFPMLQKAELTVPLALSEMGSATLKRFVLPFFFHITSNNPRHGSIIDLLLPPCVYPPRYLSVYLLLPLPQRDPTYKLNCPRPFYLSHILKVVFSPKTNLN